MSEQIVARFALGALSRADASLAFSRADFTLLAGGMSEVASSTVSCAVGAFQISGFIIDIATR